MVRPFMKEASDLQAKLLSLSRQLEEREREKRACVEVRGEERTCLVSSILTLLSRTLRDSRRKNAKQNIFSSNALN